MELIQATAIVNAILQSKHTTLAKSVITKSIRYTQLRCEWYLADNEQRREMDQERTLAHNALISAFDILSRNMQQSDEDTSWRKWIGTDRKEIGDFACLLVAVIGIKAR